MKKKILDDERKVKLSTLVYGLLILVVIFLTIVVVLAYGPRTEIGNKVAAKIALVVPFPAAIVDWKHVVYINDVEANLFSVMKFYQGQDFAKEGLRVDFTTEAGKKRLRIKEREIVDKMVENSIVEILANQRGIFISDQDAEKIALQKLNEFGTADSFKDDLLKSYGWSMVDFRRQVFLPNIYAEALAAKIATEELSNNTEAKDKITQAQKQLESGKDFGEVVRNYSEGTSKDNGGALGWVKKEQILPELQDALFGENVPVKNAIIESSIGFHIVEIENSKKENGEKILQIKQIFTQKKTFADWLENQKKQMRVFVPLADFTWNMEKGMVDFRDMAMREFEKQERSKMQGDGSITF